MGRELKGKIILTGGAGFIGSCFLWRLNRAGIDEAIVVDDLADGQKWKNLAGKRFDDYIHKGGFLDMLESGKLGQVDAVVHLGACSSTLLSDADYYFKNNYDYSKRLAVWAAANSVRFIYASSAATYGGGETGYDDAESGLHDLKPLNIYGYTKHLFDLWMLRNGLLKKAVGFKLFNVFGPNEYHKGEMMSVVCKRFKDINEGGPLRLFKSHRAGCGDGEQKRDFIYVKDVVEVMYYFFEKPREPGIYNLGSGQAHSWNELARAMFLSLGKEPKIEYADMPGELRANYQYFTQAKMDKLRAAGCKYAFTPLRDAIGDYCAYLKQGSYL